MDWVDFGYGVFAGLAAGVASLVGWILHAAGNLPDMGDEETER